MSSGDDYRAKAAEFATTASNEVHAVTRVELESLARAYVRLAEQADRNSTNDIVYVTPVRDRDSSEA